MIEGMSFDEKSGMDVLLELLKPDNIAMKTVLTPQQIRFMAHQYYLEIRKKEPEKDAIEILGMVCEYVMQLAVSRKGYRTQDIVKGITDMRAEVFQEMMKREGERRRT